MAESNWTLTKWADRTYVDDLMVTPDLVGGSAGGYTVQKRRLRGGPSDGVDVIHIDNGALSFDVLPTRGMNVWKAWIGGQPIGWNSPVRGPVNPAFVPLADPTGLGWLDGFDELLSRCGLESNGAPEFDGQQLKYGLHGRISNKPAHQVDLRVDGDSGEITLVGIVDETRFHFTKLRLFSTISTIVGEPIIRIRDTIQNLSASQAEIQLLYHVNFGPPLLGRGARVVAPLGKLVPRNTHSAEGRHHWDSYGEPSAGAEERVFFCSLQGDDQRQTSVLLKNADGSLGTSLQFNLRQLPCFTLWKNETAEEDGYVTGLEPATNFPNPRSFETRQGRIIPLEPGGTCSFDLQLQVHPTAGAVDVMEQQIKDLCTVDPVLDDAPQPHWCADA